MALDFGVDYWEDLIVPLDNYISKGTATFLSSTNPNYQESLYQMVEHTLSGEPGLAQHNNNSNNNSNTAQTDCTCIKLMCSC